MQMPTQRFREGECHKCGAWMDEHSFFLTLAPVCPRDRPKKVAA